MLLRFCGHSGGCGEGQSDSGQRGQGRGEESASKTAKRRVCLSPDDVHRLADECGEPWTVVLVVAYCGIRWGEAVGLRVRDVQFLRRRLNVNENAVQLGVNHAVGPTKGKKDRSVPVPEFVLA